MAKFHLLLMLLFYSVRSYGQLGFHFVDDLDKVRIYSEIHSNLFVVPLFLNEKMPLFFILDTGVRNSILTEKKISDILGVKYDRKYTIKGAGGEHLIDAFVTNDIRIGMQGIKSNGNSMLVLEKDYIELTNFLGTNVHGMFGYELFSRFVVQMNYSRKYVRFIESEKFKPSRRYIKIPIIIEDTKPYILAPVLFEDGSQHTLKLLIDTGASHGLMLDPYSDKKVKIPKKTIDATIGRGLGGKIEGQIGRIGNIAIGEFNLKNAIASFPYEGSYADSITSSNIFRHGSIGGEILSRFNVFFDYSKEVMYIKKNQSFRKGFYYNLSGMTIRAEGPNLKKFLIEEIRESSPAYKTGILKNDQIISINNYDVEKMTLSEISSYFNSKPGKIIALEIKRGNKILRFKFKLQSAV